MIFTGDSFSCHSLKLLLKSFSFAYHPKERSWTPGTRAAYGDSKVELGSRGSHGVNGCPCSQFDAAALALQAGAEEFPPLWLSPNPGAQQPRSRARCSPAGVVDRLPWQLDPRPSYGFPMIYGWGSHCPFSLPFPLTSPPEPPQLPPAGTSACSTRNCPVGARFSNDTQGLKIVTILHPIGPSICCLIYE